MSETEADRSIHIALTFDDSFWAPASAVMRSVCLTTTRRPDLIFHLCHDGLRAERALDFEAIVEEFGVRVLHYALAEHAEFNRICRALPVDKRLHTVMYARLLIDRILPAGIGRVIYLDCDTLVLTPIERLYERDLEGMAIAAAPDPVRLLNMLGRDMREKAGIFEPTAPYFNSGVLLIDMEKFAATDVPGWIEVMHANGLIGRLYFDQDMLNLMFAGNWTALPWRFNVMDPKVAHQTMDPFILHYTGHARPWHLYANVAHRRTYRHVMTNALFYRYMRYRWAHWWTSRLGAIGSWLKGVQHSLGLGK
jgi:lipopolysaccharide biosynthesis glycosyltransferase